MRDNLQNGLRIRYICEEGSQLREIVIEFGKWLRKKVIFPVRLTFYVRETYKSQKNNLESFIASFNEPDRNGYYPFSRIDVGNHRDADLNRIQFIESILTSIAHETIHYKQWISKLSYDEDQAETEADRLVDEFIEDRLYNVTVTSKIIKLWDLADNKSENGNFDEAVQLYIEAIKMGCEDDGIYNAIGYCFDNLEKYEEALYYYDKALSLNSKDPIVYMNKGYCLFYLNKYHDAIANLNKSLEIEPSKEAYIFKGDAERELNMNKEAMDSYDAAIKLDTNYEIAYNLKGQLYYDMGDFQSAKEACLNAISIDSNYADAYYNLSLACAKLGENTSDDYLKMAISLDEMYKELSEADES